MPSLADSRWVNDSTTMNSATNPFAPRASGPLVSIFARPPLDAPIVGAKSARPKKQLSAWSSPNPRPIANSSLPIHSTLDHRIRGPRDLQLPSVEDVCFMETNGDFDGSCFVGHLENDYDDDFVFEYLKKAPGSLLRRGMMVQEVPLIFYIVASSNIRLLRLALRMGCDVNCMADCAGIQIPLLVFSIMHSYLSKIKMHEVTSVLLGAGAKVADQIPSWYFQSATKDLGTSTMVERIGADARKAWCTVPEYRKVFELGLDMYTRQCLGRACNLHVRQRDVQIARLRKADAITELPYTLVGQRLAIERMHDILMDRMLNSDSKPLILVLAGPSGHGKTELASKLADLLSIDVSKVDCASGREMYDFFGILGMYNGADEGTPLNNFLASKDGKDGLVILDEFEKTSQEVHDALLNTLGSGEYQDRTKNKNVDCNRIIWIITTNAFDSQITKYYKENQTVLEDETTAFKAQQNCYDTLTHELRKEATIKFSKPTAGRITDFVPFLPFNTEDQLVGVEKYLADFTSEACLPVRTTQPLRLFGDVELSVIEPEKLCKFIAEDAYIPDLGMRSLKNAMKSKLERVVRAKYRDIAGHVEENGLLTKMVLRLVGGKVVAEIAE